MAISATLPFSANSAILSVTVTRCSRVRVGARKLRKMAISLTLAFSPNSAISLFLRACGCSEIAENGDIGNFAIFAKFCNFVVPACVWMSCHTQEEIAEVVGLTKETVSERMRLCQDLDTCLKSDKLNALYQDADFRPYVLTLLTLCANSANSPFFSG